jgi:hypothetical protein
VNAASSDLIAAIATLCFGVVGIAGWLHYLWGAVHHHDHASPAPCPDSGTGHVPMPETLQGPGIEHCDTGFLGG